LQEQQCKNHAKPSLRSGADLKVKPMLGRRSRAARQYAANVYVMAISYIIKTRLYYRCTGIIILRQLNDEQN